MVKGIPATLNNTHSLTTVRTCYLLCLFLSSFLFSPGSLFFNCKFHSLALSIELYTWLGGKAITEPLVPCFKSLIGSSSQVPSKREEGRKREVKPTSREKETSTYIFFHLFLLLAMSKECSKHFNLSIHPFDDPVDDSYFQHSTHTHIHTHQHLIQTDTSVHMYHLQMNN